MKHVFVLLASTFGIMPSAHAHPYSAEREFLRLKRTGEFINYLENQTYLEVGGTSFIGLQYASNTSRTCLFGLNRKGLDAPGTFQVQTRFVCFNKDQYQLTIKKEWCELGTKGCEIDPGGISVGIGNLDILPSMEFGEELPLPGSFYDAYPKFLNVDVFRP